MNNTLEKILRAVIICGVFAIPFIPLIVTSSILFPFISGKNFTFRILVEIVTGAWVMLALINPLYRPKRNLLFWALAAFSVIILIADISGAYFFKSFWSNFERMEGFVTLIHLVAYIVVAWTTLKPKTWEYLFQTNLFASFIIAIYGFVQLGGGAAIHQGGTRLDASLGNATYLAIYMLFNIFFALFLMLRHRGFWPKMLYGLSAIINVVILYHTATRGALLGLLGGLFLAALLIAIFEKHKKGLRKVSIGVVIASVCIVALFFGIKNTAFITKSPVLSRFSSISLTETTTKSRFMIWNMAWQGFKQHPVLGWGQENFNYVFNTYYNPQMYNQEQWFDRTHNVILDWLIAGGTLGLLSYFSLFVAVLYLLWRKTNLSLADKALFTGLLAGYTIHNLFVFDNLTSYILFFSVLAYVATMSDVAQAGPSPMREQEAAWRVGGANTYPVGVVVGIVFVAIVYFTNVPAIAAGQGVIKAISPGSTPAQKLEVFKSALAHHTLGTPEIREQLVTFFSSLIQSNPAPDIRRSYYDFTKAQMDDQLAHTPKDARYQLFAATFYESNGEYDQALKYINNAQQLSPKKQTILFEQSSINVNLKNFDAALQIAKDAYDLAPEYNEAKIIYAVVAIYAKKTDLANSLIKQMPAATALDQRIIGAFVSTKQFSAARALLEQKLADNPDNVELRISLTSIYLEVGERTKAIDQLFQIGKLNPDYKETADAYIEQIRAGKTPGQP